MFRPKPISQDSVASALSKAERYRLLNEPTEAESICHDILDISPDNQQALISLVLALTDQIPDDPQAFRNSVSAAERLSSPYDRAYYTGIAWERRAKARQSSAGRGAHHYAYDWIVTALHYFEDAEKHRAPGNDDAILRWNACVRFLGRHKELTPHAEEAAAPVISE